VSYSLIVKKNANENTNSQGTAIRFAIKSLEHNCIFCFVFSVMYF